MSAVSYGTLDQLRALPRLEQDFDQWPEMRLRIQALTGAEVQRIGQMSKDPDAENGVNLALDRQLVIAYGLVQPRLDPEGNLDEALAAVEHVPVGVQIALQMAIFGLTYRKPSEAFKDFNDASGSAESAAATVSGSSS